MRRALLALLLCLCSSAADAAIAFGTASFVSGIAAGAPGTEPASAASGDTFVALTVIAGGGSVLTRPVGWTNLENGTTGATEFDYDVSCITRGGSAPDLTWTWTTSVAYEIHIIRFTGADTVACFSVKGTPFTSASGQKGTTRVASEIDPPSVTPATTTSMAIAMGVHWLGSNTSWTAPTNYTMRSTNTATIDGMIASRLLASGSAEDPDEFFDAVAAGLDSIFATTITLKEPAAGAAGCKNGLLLRGVGCDDLAFLEE